MNTAKPHARFLPTLTEVVQLQPGPQAEAPVPAGSAEALTQRVLALVEAQMAERMEAHMQALRQEMHQAMADAVQQALRETSGHQP